MDDLEDDRSRLPQIDADDGAVRPESQLLCRSCAHAITSTREAIEIAGSHVHTRLNPANVVFHFGCFREAPGCRVTGEPSSEHVWFAGCLWQYAHCGACNAHLGWSFSGADTFYGLIADRLTAGP